MCGRDIHMWMGHSHVEVLMCEGDIQMWEVLLCGGVLSHVEGAHV